MDKTRVKQMNELIMFKSAPLNKYMLGNHAFSHQHVNIVNIRVHYHLLNTKQNYSANEVTHMSWCIQQVIK